ncbi:MAG: DUF1996 domain-containing protein [Solirubrobacteraceae bacterium]
MQRRTAAALTVLATIAAAVALTISATAQQRRAGQAGFFSSPCQFTHRASNDPIVFPGQPGASHSHDFFGNPSLDAASTLASLDAAMSRCRRGEDRAGYWVPTLYQGDRIVAPLRTTVYYRTAGRDPASIEPFPAGLRVIAGSAKATSAQDRRIVHWGCTSGATPPRAVTTAPLCPPGTRLRLSVRFPECWNGRDLDSADHVSHLASAVRIGRGLRGCPASHPHALPKLVVNVPYATRGGSGLRLASGSINTAHADFFNAWEPAGLARLVRECLNADVHCQLPPPVRRRNR